MRYFIVCCSMTNNLHFGRLVSCMASETYPSHKKIQRIAVDDSNGKFEHSDVVVTNIIELNMDDYLSFLGDQQ